MNLQRSLRSHNIQRFKGLENPGMLVSIVQITDNLYLIANYRDILLLNNETNHVSIMQTEIAEGSYCPTGLFYKNDQLYVANYLANNILVFTIDISNHKLNLLYEIKNNHTIGPENVAVNDDGTILVAANYVGSSIVAFDISQQPKEIWNIEVKLAHGICILGNKTYATSLGDRTISEVDINTGQIIRSVGKLGWLPQDTEFLWPTCVTIFSSSELMLSDAHTGLVYLIDVETLSIRKCFGGNGPTLQYFNMPYGVSVSNDLVIVLSTLQGRIVELDKKNFQVVKTIINPQYGTWDQLPQKSVIPLGYPQWKGYNFESGPRLEILGERYVLSYSRLCPESNKLPFLMEPSVPFNFGMMYFFNTKIFDNGYLVFSPQTIGGFFITKQDNLTYIFPVCIPLDSWTIDNEIYNSNGKIDVSTLPQTMSEKIKMIESSRYPNGLVPENSIYEFYNEIIKIDISFHFTNNFTSKPGQEFYKYYKKLVKDPQNVDCATVVGLVTNYLRQIKNERGISISEIILVQMLTGVDFNI